MPPSVDHGKDLLTRPNNNDDDDDNDDDDGGGGGGGVGGDDEDDDNDDDIELKLCKGLSLKTCISHK